MFGFFCLLIATSTGISCAPPPPLPPPPPIGFVGDSITEMSLGRIQEGLGDCGVDNLVFDALSGRQAALSYEFYGYRSSGYSAIERIEDEYDPDIWVFEMGVNDIQVGSARSADDFRGVIEGAIALVDETDDIYWVNTYTESTSGAPAFNAVLAEYDRIGIIDWAAVAPSNVYDGLHPNEGGVEVLIDMYCTTLNTNHNGEES